MFKMMYAVKIQVSYKTVQTQIRLLLEEQFDHRLHYFSFNLLL